MNKIKIYLITFIFSMICYGNAVAGTGAATEYKITIYKMELCDSTSTASVCNGAVTVYDGNSGAIDIANTTAGAAAADLSAGGNRQGEQAQSDAGGLHQAGAAHERGTQS